MSAVGEADESLRDAGFTPCGEVLDEGNDDCDGNTCPPPHASASGGGLHQQRLRMSIRSFIEIWSCDKETGSGVGFACALDENRAIFYAKLETHAGGKDAEGNKVLQNIATEQSTKGAITTLLDVAEACKSRKITLGLGIEHTSCAEFVCSLLYLGFQVVPSRKCPLVGVALLLDFDIGWPSPPGVRSTSEHESTGISDCSTSAEEEESSHEKACPAELHESE